MKNILQNSILPFALFAGALTLLGCDQVSNPNSDTEQKVVDADTSIQVSTESAQQAPELKSGNMFYIVRDVADVQLKAGDYLEKIKQTQNEVQTAISNKNTEQLQASANLLKEELISFNQTLASLNLKSQEIDDIRQKIMQSNQQVLSSSLMNGNIDLSKVDFKKIEQQMGNVQSEMIKLAGMLLENNAKTSTENTPQTTTES